MLRRSNQAAFAGGMYVFPGGRVDQEDHSPIYDGHLQGPSVAQAPSAQSGLHDGTETVDSVWISPNDALKQHDAGDFGLMAVTQKQLSSLTEYHSVSDLITIAQENDEFPTYRPVIPAGV